MKSFGQKPQCISSLPIVGIPGGLKIRSSLMIFKIIDFVQEGMFFFLLLSALSAEKQFRLSLALLILSSLAVILAAISAKVTNCLYICFN